MIYFDNSATTYPKPKCVIKAVTEAMSCYGANPGRGGNPLSVKASQKVYEVREKAANMFGVAPERVVFTSNATHASNTAIKGMLDKSCHCLISDYEHNAVWRPVHSTCPYGIFEVKSCKEDTLYSIKTQMRRNTRCIVCTAVSNVTGRILPIKEICDFARNNGLYTIIDASQAAGYLPMDVKDIGCDILFTSGHKGLYGPFGTGMMLLGNDIKLRTLIEGGTGTNSEEPFQPNFPPERYEAGTINMCGIIGLGAGMDFVEKNDFSHEYELTSYLRQVLVSQGFDVYDKEYNFTPVTSFNIPGIESADVDSKLGEAGICVRSGLHCAPLAHRKLGTEEKGTVRVSIGAFNTKKDVDYLIDRLIKIKKFN